jgi:antirestriction protein ArdC
MSRNGEKSRGDLYTRITDRIIAELERGVRPWVQPWTAANIADRITRPLRHNGQPYTGINVLLLWSEAIARGFCSPIWMTFKQASELGAYVRKGETGSTVVYASRFTKTETDAHGDEIERDIPFLKAYTVFCVDQIDGLPAHYYGRPPVVASTIERNAHADAFFANTGAIVRHGGSMAFYAPSSDHIQMPPIEVSATWPPMLPSEPMRPCTGPLQLTASIAISAVTARIGANARRADCRTRELLPLRGSRDLSRTRPAAGSCELPRVVVGGLVM